MSHIGAALCVVLLLGGALGVAQTVLLSMAGAAVAYSRFGALQNGFRRADLQNKLDPFMIHELLPSLTETASGSHPCCVVSVTYDRTFTAVTRVQIPSGTPNLFKSLRGTPTFRAGTKRHNSVAKFLARFA